MSLKSTNIYALHRRLQNNYEELQSLTVAQMDSMAYEYQERIYSVLFAALNINNVCEVIQERQVNRQNEMNSSMDPDDIVYRDNLYRNMLKDLIENELKKLEINHIDCSFIVQPTFKNKKYYLKLISSLTRKFVRRSSISNDDNEKNKSTDRNRKKSSSLSSLTNKVSIKSNDDTIQHIRRYSKPIKFESTNEMKIEQTNVMKVYPSLDPIRKENMRLKNELKDMKELYQQLLDESGMECYNNRRVHLLKAQNMQLEKQISILSANREQRSTILHELLSHLDKIYNLLDILPKQSVVLYAENEWLEWINNVRERLKRVCDHISRVHHTKLLQPWEYLQRGECERLNLDQLRNGDTYESLLIDDYLDIHQLHSLEDELVILCENLKGYYNNIENKTIIKELKKSLETIIWKISTIGVLVKHHKSYTTTKKQHMVNTDTLDRMLALIENDTIKPKNTAKKLYHRLKRDYSAFQEYVELLSTKQNNQYNNNGDISSNDPTPKICMICNQREKQLRPLVLKLINSLNDIVNDEYATRDEYITTIKNIIPFINRLSTSNY